MKINYPTWEVKSSPTPAQTLYVCDNCGKAEWSYHGVIMQCYCGGTKKGGPRRMRQATAKETETGKQQIKFIL